MPGSYFIDLQSGTKMRIMEIFHLPEWIPENGKTAGLFYKVLTF
jgi:hypothetical protein